MALHEPKPQDTAATSPASAAATGPASAAATAGTPTRYGDSSRQGRRYRVLHTAASAAAKTQVMDMAEPRTAAAGDAERAEEEARADSLWDQRCRTLYKAWVQVRYHRRKQRFFDLIDKLTKSATVLLGATLIGDALKREQPLIAAGISGLGLLALVFGYGDRKQLHGQLAEQAANLIAAIEAVPAGELTPGKTAGWAADYARLTAKAPPPQKTLTLICEREQSIADGHPNHVPKVPLLLRLVAYFY